MIGNREVLKGNQEPDGTHSLRSKVCAPVHVISYSYIIYIHTKRSLFLEDITQIVRVMDAFNKNREIVTTLREAMCSMKLTQIVISDASFGRESRSCHE